MNSITLDRTEAIIANRLHILDFNIDMSTVRFEHDRQYADRVETSSYRVEFEYCDDESCAERGDLVLIDKNSDADEPMYMIVGKPVSTDFTTEYAINAKDFEALHNTISHMILELYTNGFNSSF